MPNSPPSISPAPVQAPFVDPATGHVPSHVAIWLNEVFHRIGGVDGRPVIGEMAWFEVMVAYSDVASAGTKTVLAAQSGETWKIREIQLSGDGTNFSGGDRLLDITDGTTVWTSIPAATLQALAAARWGDTGVPYPSSGMMTASATDIIAQYSGGTTDYTAGELTLAILAERTA